MPLLKTEILSEAKIWGVWKLEEEVNTLFDLLDLSREEKGYKEIAHPNKLKEWAGSRLIAMELCAKMGWGYPGISKDEYGKPFFNDWSLGISVSHKYPYVVVMLDRYNDVGIDVEPVTDRIMRLGHKFMNEQESQWGTTPFWVTLIWAAKEALYKLHGRKQLLFKEQLFIKVESGDEIKGKLNGLILDGEPEEVELIYQKDVEDLLIVYTI